MNRKIICILICTLLITTVSPTWSMNNSYTDTPKNESGFECSDELKVVKNRDSGRLNLGLVRNNDTGEIFDTIQEAINDNDTKDGHTIFVEPGTYQECVTINKSINLVGASRDSTIIDGEMCEGPVIIIEKNSVTVRNFKIINAGESFYAAGVEIYRSNDVTLKNLWVSDSHQGISLESSSNASIHNIRLDDCSMYIDGEKLGHYLHDVQDVMVNGRPLCYYKYQTGVIPPSDAVSIILVKCSDVTIQDMDLNDMNVGVEVAYSSNIDVIGSTFVNNDFGIVLLNSSNGIIDGCTVSENKLTGLSLINCSGINIKSNSISSNKNYGIYLGESSGCSITDDNRIENNEDGIYLLRSANIIIEYNTFTNNGLFIKGDSLDHFIHTINGNTINGKDLLYYKNANRPYPPADAGCVIFVNCNEGIIEGMDFEMSDIGFECAFCEDTEIKDSAFSSLDYGMYSYSSSGIVIKNCNFSNCERGIYLENCSDAQIKENGISNNRYGIRLKDSTNCHINDNNIVFNSGTGIYLEESPDNHIWENTINRNVHGIKLLYSSDTCMVDNNTIKGTGWENRGGDGIKMSGSDDCTITCNDIFSCYGEGIWLEDGTNNHLVNNNIRSNRGNGIQLVCATSNFIKGNYINLNCWGIRIDSCSSGNKIWRNKFWWNGNRLSELVLPGGGNACDDSKNIWNGSYRSEATGGIIGGNYWSNWQLLPPIRTDYYKGLYPQTMDGSDGVIDQPYSIRDCSGNFGNNTDYYPLRSNCTWLPDDNPPECNIRYPSGGYLYVRGKSVTRIPCRTAVVFGNIDITVYAEDKVAFGFASDHVTVDFYVDDIDGSPEWTANELDDDYECHWSAWDRPYFGRHTLTVIAKDSCGLQTRDDMAFWIFSI